MDKKLLNKLTFLYLIIPTIIFLLGWCKFYFSIPLTVALIFIYIKRYELKKLILKKLVLSLKKNKKEILITLLIALLYVFISGIGGFVFQNDDHLYRNAIFEELVNNKWPVVYGPIANFKSDIFLVYYFAFWLPSAVIGKLFGISLGYIFLYIWSVIGIALLFGYFKNYYKKSYLIPILIFIFFSGLDIIERFLYGNDILALINSSVHLEWTTGFQISSFTTQLFWVFNQSIPAWLITLFILNEEDSKILGIIFAMSLIFCTLPAIGLVFIVIYKIFFADVDFLKIIKSKTKFNKWFKNVCTWENLIIGVPLLVICGLFVKSNLAGSNTSFALSKYNILNILVTIIFEFLIYYLLIYKYHKKSALFYISMISLLICPMISVNNGGDFCMRASIPGLVILFILILQSLEMAQNKNDRKFIKILAILLILGSITPFNEIKRTIKNTNFDTKYEKLDLITSPCQKNFFGYTKDSLFYKYIAKKN